MSMLKYNLVNSLSISSKIGILLGTLCMAFLMSSHATEEKEILKNPRILLTHEEKNFFYENGYIICKNVLTPDEVEKSKRCVDRLIGRAENLFDKLKREYGNNFPGEAGEYTLSDGMTFKIVTVARGSTGCHFDVSENNGETSTQTVIGIEKGDEAEPKLSIHRFVWAPGVEPYLLTISEIFYPIIGELMGCEGGNQPIASLHTKRVGDNLKFDPHQDVENRGAFNPNWHDNWGKIRQNMDDDLRAKNINYIAAIAAFTCSDSETGGLQGVPGRRDNLHLKAIKDPEELKRTIANLGESVNLDLNPGDVVLMSQDFVHWSGKNLSLSDRRDLYITGVSGVYNGRAVNENSNPYPGKGNKSNEIVRLVY